MTGLEAFIALRNRKNIRRKCWDENQLVKWTAVNENQMSMQILKNDYDLKDKIYRHANLFANLLGDLLEYDDWEIVE
jgi:hypothetical protein